MDLAVKQHPVETLVDWCAPAILAGAAGWSAWIMGLTPQAVAAIAVAALAAAMLAMRTLGHGAHSTPPAFEPLPIETDDAEHDELLLDDPLGETEDDSRVVRLFAKQEPTPGELLLRIEDFLGDGGRRIDPHPAANAPPPAAADAGAALQAALANIRASLK
jgi:hypothetical protein